MLHTRKEILAIGDEIANKIFHKKNNHHVTIEGWVARDKSGRIYLYEDRPTKHKTCYFANGGVFVIPESAFTNVKWSDEEPTKVKITITINN